ncbi:uncharacterized protein LOC121859875 [Homarus americanus]|uniref:uncharacterized protein LOC121859875 n=1 Tax=Homarus americanus TaxID=6706 RepID=UPI001C469187|nr:uncharacterized protein LOC121859875 [Homarus americanus]
MEEALGVKEESISSLGASLDSHNGSRGSWDTERNLPQSNTHSSLTPFTDGIKQEDIKFEVEVTQEFIAEEEADTVAQDPVVKEEKEFIDVDKVRIEDEHVAPEVDGLSCVTTPVTSSSSPPDHPSSRKATKTKTKNRDIEDRKKLKIPSSNEEWNKVAHDFELKWQLPNCIGALDGKHVVMKQRKLILQLQGYQQHSAIGIG